LQGEVDDVAEPRARSGLRVPSVGPPLVFLREVQIFSTFFFDLTHLGPSFFNMTSNFGSPFGLACLGGAAPPYYRR